LSEPGKRIILRFLTRKTGKAGKPAEFIYFYSEPGGRIFHARCERGVISSFLERLGEVVGRSRTGKTLYLEGARAEDIARRLIILAACRQCMKKSSRILDVAEALMGISEFEAIFWHSKILDEYEKKGYWGVCRVARAFRVIHRID